MASATPRYLFRVWTDQSNGTNHAKCLKSAWRTWSALGIYSHIPRSVLRKTCQGALTGIRVKSNPYVFTTCSLLYAIQHAISKTRGKGETDAHIVCIDTRTCKNADGSIAGFYAAVDIMKLYGLSMPRARYTHEEREYTDVYVTTHRIIPGPGSYYVSFEELKTAGLYKLYPEYIVISKRPNPGLESPVKDLRKLWYHQNRNLPTEELTLAAQLVSVFKPVHPDQPEPNVPSHPLAWFIALKAQGPDGKRLRRWLNSHDSHPAGSVADDDRAGFAIPEIVRYHQIHDIVRKHRVRIADVKDVDVHISRARICMQMSNYRDSKKAWGADKR